jgi:hypothetical protein
VKRPAKDDGLGNMERCRLKPHLRPNACTEDAAMHAPAVLVFNRSQDSNKRTVPLATRSTAAIAVVQTAAFSLPSPCLDTAQLIEPRAG